MSDLLEQVARLEKEFKFWTKIYAEEIPTIQGTAFKQVKQFELSLNDYRDKYRKELQTDLGPDFSVEEIVGASYPLNPLRNYFFPLKFWKHFVGIILPFRVEKEVIFSPDIQGNNPILKIFSDKGYKIERIVYHLCNATNKDMLSAVYSQEETIDLLLEGKDPI